MDQFVSSKSSLLRPISLRNGKSLPNRCMLAPMEGVMGPSFQIAAARLSLVDYWITPFIGVSQEPLRHKTLRHKLRYYLASKLPVIPQLLGKDPDNFAETVARIDDIGCYGVNFNFACPSKRVLTHRNGGFLLKEPDVIRRILATARERCPDFSISVKIRIGFDSPKEIERIMPAVLECEPDFIMLHFRTVREQYGNVEDGWKRLAMAKELCSESLLIGNGDITIPQDAVHMLETTNCDGVAVGRGILKNPFLLLDIKNELTGVRKDRSGDESLIFLNTLREIGLENPDKLWNRNHFMEMIRAMFGADHQLFQTCKKMTSEELLKSRVFIQQCDPVKAGSW